MNIQYYVYTCTLNKDFRNLIIPHDISFETLTEAKGLARSVLNTDGYLSHPVWLLYKKGAEIIWGVCCHNELLNSGVQADKQNRPARGFFGIYISELSEDVSVPFDIDFFKELYINEVTPIWDTYKADAFHSRQDVYSPEGYNTIYPIDEIRSVDLNTDIFFCKAFNSLEVEGFISSALSLSYVSLLVNNTTIEQALGSANYKSDSLPFMNCVSSEVQDGQIPVKRKCSKCGEMVSGFAHESICYNCDEIEKIQKLEVEEDMKYKEEVEELERELRDKQSLIDDLNNKLLLKERLLKIVCIICGVLLAALVFIVEKICE